MNISAQVEKADRLRSLHQGPDILVLPNAWDVASAIIFARAGFPAIASTSAGIAATLGYPDGQRISRDEMVTVVERIARAVDCPVTADMEAGYGATVADALNMAQAVIAAGAVGLNFEDATDSGPQPLADVTQQVARIKAIREACATAGVPLVINARTDVYLLDVGNPEDRFDEAVRRLNAYREAGADCLFAPGVRDAETIGRLVQAIHGPLNILAGAGTPPIQELARLGVARVSMGSGPMRATLGLTQRIALELRDQGTYSSFTEGSISYADTNRLFER